MLHITGQGSQASTNSAMKRFNSGHREIPGSSCRVALELYKQEKEWAVGVYRSGQAIDENPVVGSSLSAQQYTFSVRQRTRR